MWSCFPAPVWPSSKLWGSHYGSPGLVFRMKSGLPCLSLKALQSQAPASCLSLPHVPLMLGCNQATHHSLNTLRAAQPPVLALVPSSHSSQWFLYFVLTVPVSLLSSLKCVFFWDYELPLLSSHSCTVKNILYTSAPPYGSQSAVFPAR